MGFYEIKTGFERTELHNIITQDPQNDEEAIKGEIKNIKRITNAGNVVTGEVAVVVSGNVCVSVRVPVAGVYFCANMTDTGVIQQNLRCGRLPYMGKCLSVLN